MKALIPVAALAIPLSACATVPSPPKTAKAVNLALGKTATSSSHILDFTADHVTDGDAASYFEGDATQFPDVLTIDLEKKVPLQSVTVRLNPRKIWTARTQTFSVLTSDDGGTFTTVVPSADYDFSPLDNGNAVTVPLSGTARYLQVSFTANSEPYGGQASEVEVQGR